jgi:uncharacterized protein YndB with AHSA1/START domain
MADDSKPAVNLARLIPAPQAVVFRAWTDPAELRRWWGPPGFSCPSAEIDLRVGGRYRIAMQPPDGEVIYLSGTFKLIEPPRRLVYSWRWEAAAEPVETLVTVEFHARGQATEIVLHHRLFADAAVRDRHDGGWKGCLDRLAGLFA